MATPIPTTGSTNKRNTIDGKELIIPKNGEVGIETRVSLAARQVSMVQKNRHGSSVDEGAGDRDPEQVLDSRTGMGAHHQQARV
jgi:hypothetical protein